ncbi:MAG: leucine-rich repeat protein [Lachnospiraceae bacterium]|nr:leucine-rich repeat protein [Lachnospiraceae bacterium]
MSVVPDPEDEAGAALLDAVLTDEQQEAYKSEPVELILSVAKTELSSKEEKKCEESTEKLEAMISDGGAADKNIEVSDELESVFSGDLSAPADEDGKAGKPEIVVVKAYDFKVSLKVGDNKPVEVHDLGSAMMTVKFRIDKELKNTNPLVRRIFFMIHFKSDGKTEILPVNVSAKNMKASVAFNSCSTFVLAYTDVAEFTEAGSTLTSSKYNAKYKIIEGGDVNGKVGVLEYVSPIKKKARHTVYTKVKIDGITYKVTSIAANAFKGNKTVKKVTIGKYITSIGNKAFYKATGLEKVIIKSKKLKSANIGTSVWTKAGSAGDGITFTVPSSKLKSYKKLFGKVGTVEAK